MKLRNKKTGEIINSKDLLTDEFIIDLFSKDFNYLNSKLDKIQEEWEDYEEQKEYWSINEFGTLVQITHNRENIYDKSRKNFGNYFETKEEAEKAVEKLKAWKWLKDKGLRFCGYSHGTIDFYLDVRPLTDEEDIIAEKDLTFLFGGEE